jgi:Trypsin
LVGAYQNEKTTNGAKRLWVKKELLHPWFNDNLEWDFSVAVLKSKSTVAPIKLNTAAKNPSGTEKLTVIGMGITNQKGSADPPYLLEVDVNHVPITKCISKYPRGWVAKSSMVRLLGCVRNESDHHDACLR